MAYDEEAHRQFLLRAATRAVEEERLRQYLRERADVSSTGQPRPYVVVWGR